MQKVIATCCYEVQHSLHLLPPLALEVGSNEWDQKMQEYHMEIIDDGRCTMGVEGEFENDDDALRWAYYYLGRYRCDSVKLYAGEFQDARGVPLIEISVPEHIRAWQQQGPELLKRYGYTTNETR